MSRRLCARTTRGESVRGGQIGAGNSVLGRESLEDGRESFSRSQFGGIPNQSMHSFRSVESSERSFATQWDQSSDVGTVVYSDQDYRTQIDPSVVSPSSNADGSEERSRRSGEVSISSPALSRVSREMDRSRDSGSTGSKLSLVSHIYSPASKQAILVQQQIEGSDSEGKPSPFGTPVMPLRTPAMPEFPDNYEFLQPYYPAPSLSISEVAFKLVVGCGIGTSILSCPLAVATCGI